MASCVPRQLKSQRIVIDIASKTVMVSRQSLQVLGRIACTIEAGSFVSIIGPSGCGKSTLLRAIMGLDLALDGKILIGGNPVTGPGIERGIVFQEPRLLPWAKVRDNIAFATPADVNRGRSTVNIDRLMRLFGLVEFANAWPNQLSGGMMQRVALARALVNLPDVLLMDEPFGALDAHTKTVLQEEFADVFRTQLTTTIMVTHDVEEAVYLSDAVMIMTGRPGCMRDIVKIDLPKPRERSDPSFVKLRFEILNRAFGG